MTQEERIAQLEQGLLSATRLAWLLVKASGGRVSISQRTLESLNPVTSSLHAHRDDVTGSYVYESWEV